MTHHGDFIFKRYAYEKDAGELHLFYAYEDGPAFEETITFPPCARLLPRDAEQALDHAFRLIFLLAGVSYYKAYIPPRLRCEAFTLDAATAAFVEKVYRHGLGEFAYRHNVALNITFGVNAAAHTPAPLALDLPHGALVPVGGGKDSIVTIEALKRAGEPITLFALGAASGAARPIKDTIAASGLPSLYVSRRLSKNLMELNKTDALNGHVPITAILSSIAVACAILHGHNAVVLSNEHSASAPNIKTADTEVNHQYSKSLTFERDFSNYVRGHISPDINYFSFLRPLTETAIARRFAALEGYHTLFRSCNAAFRQDETTRNKNWCCACPKCRFVFLALAPFMNREKLVALFGQNLLADAAQIDGFKELCGLSTHKPFECVGEIEESALLIAKLSRTPAWRGDAVVAELARALVMDDKTFEDRYAALFTNQPDHLVPSKYLGILDAPL